MNDNAGEATLADWTIDRCHTWPPRGRPQPPLSPTSSERLRTCRLQAAFHASDNYPRRSIPRARLGTAFHAVLQQLTAMLETAGDLPPRAVRARAVDLFRAVVAEQRERALRHARERKLPWPDKFIRDMEVQIALAASAIARQRASVSVPQSDLSVRDALSSHADVADAEGMVGPVIEEDLSSPDGLIIGRPDHVEQGSSGPIIIDYKTGSLSDPERLARYERQCLLYAWLWHECRGVWPVEYRLVHEATGHTYSAPVVPEAAIALAGEVRQLALEMSAPSPPDEQAAFGPHCSRCEYRPWCEPFWRWGATPIVEARSHDRPPRLSLQGELVAPPDRVGNYLHLYFRSGLGLRTVAAPLVHFAYLCCLPVGTRLRMLDAVPSSRDDNWLMLNAWSEVFVVSYQVAR